MGIKEVKELPAARCLIYADGVKKEDIDLRIIPEGLRLEAKRDKHTSYVSEYAFACDADPDHVKADYHEGVLNVDIPLKCRDPYVDGKKIVLS